MCVCMHACIHACMYSCMHACMYVCSFVCICIYIYIYIRIHIGGGSKPRVVAGRPLPPLLQIFVAAGCNKPFVADVSRLCLNTLPQGFALFFWGGLLRRGLSQNTPVCYKPMSRNGRPSLLQTQCFWFAAIYTHVYTRAYVHVHAYFNIYNSVDICNYTCTNVQTELALDTLQGISIYC